MSMTDKFFRDWAAAETALARAVEAGKPSIALQDQAHRAEEAYYLAEALDNYGLEIDPFDVPATIPDAVDPDDLFNW